MASSNERVIDLSVFKMLENVNQEAIVFSEQDLTIISVGKEVTMRKITDNDMFTKEFAIADLSGFTKAVQLFGEDYNMVIKDNYINFVSKNKDKPKSNFKFNFAEDTIKESLETDKGYALENINDYRDRVADINKIIKGGIKFTLSSDLIKHLKSIGNSFALRDIKFSYIAETKSMTVTILNTDINIDKNFSEIIKVDSKTSADEDFSFVLGLKSLIEKDWVCYQFIDSDDLYIVSEDGNYDMCYTHAFDDQDEFEDF